MAEDAVSRGCISCSFVAIFLRMTWLFVTSSSPRMTTYGALSRSAERRRVFKVEAL